MRPGAAVVVVLLLSGACTPGDGGTSAPASSGGPSPVSAPPSAPASPLFRASIGMLTDVDRAGMTGVSWREGCPVPLADLRRLTVSHWGFDGRVRAGGVLIVHADAAEDLRSVFRRLFEARFPVARIEPVDRYGGDDLRSMDANNTSAFNCRPATGSTSSWSEHAYGRAIDLNPVQNPWVPRSGPILPPAGERFADRSHVRPGMIVEGDAVTEAFDAIGWGWGGRWSSTLDYQHFSASGR